MILDHIIKILFPLKICPSTIGFNSATHRASPSKTTTTWLSGKRHDDGADGLWRVHDNLYDLSDFVKHHPGGPEWLQLTKGTDITENFESHHISDKAERLLPKFFIRKATKPRNSPFTFNDADFYRTLKRNVADVYPNLPKWPIMRSKLLADFFVVTYIILTFLATMTWNFKLGLVAGFFLHFTSVAAHNFFHQKDNFRMYYFNFCLMSSRGWRISHAMSHHMYTNTVKDMEVLLLEPYLQYLTYDKSVFVRYASWLYSPIVYGSIFFGSWARDLIEIVNGKQNFTKARLLPYLLPLTIYLLTQTHPLKIAIMYLWILVCGSFYFGLVGVNAAHHHPDIFHDGDKPRSKQELDWGIFQLDAVMDRNEITKSSFLVLTHFGDHALHHLFPTLDHGVLDYLYPTVLKTCEEFGIPLRFTSQYDLILGQFRQLAKTKDNKAPPAPLKVKKDMCDK